LFGKEQITEQEYGQITFDRIVYFEPFEKGLYDPKKDKLKVNVGLYLDSDEEITDVEQIG
jgi:hypothetical protein